MNERTDQVNLDALRKLTDSGWGDNTLVPKSVLRRIISELSISRKSATSAVVLDDERAALSIDSGAAMKVAERFGFPLNLNTLNFAHAILKRADELKARAASPQATATQAEAGVSEERGLTDEQIRDIFMAHGFTIKEGHTDLKPYVYAAARAAIAQSGKAVAFNETELSPCPFCGGAPMECGATHPMGTWVQCESCGARSQQYDRWDKTFAHWNQRIAAPQPPQPAKSGEPTVAETHHPLQAYKEIPADLLARVDHIDEHGYVHWKKSELCTEKLQSIAPEPPTPSAIWLDDVQLIFERQTAGFERAFEALGITDDRTRNWSTLVMAINDLQDHIKFQETNLWGCP